MADSLRSLKLARAWRRDMQRWPYAHALWRGDELLIATVHKTVVSLMFEVMASQSRIAKGDATDMDTDGVPDDVVAGWREASGG